MEGCKEFVGDCFLSVVLHCGQWKKDYIIE